MVMVTSGMVNSLAFVLNLREAERLSCLSLWRGESMIFMSHVELDSRHGQFHALAYRDPLDSECPVRQEVVRRPLAATWRPFF